MTQDPTKIFIVACPACRKEMQVLIQFAGEAVQCPHCSQTIRVPIEIALPPATPVAIPPTPASEERMESDAIETLLPPKISGKDAKPTLAPIPSPIPSLSQSSNQSETRPTESQPTADLLPPKYQGSDSSDAWIQTGGRSVVILPTADGGTQAVDQNTVTIEYQGQKYILAKLTPEQRERRRQIANAISILIAIVAIAIAIWVLLF